MSERASVTVAVHQAVAAYAQALDDGRTDDIVATFCTDGTAQFPGTPKFEGHAALRETYAQMQPAAGQRHMMVNTLVTSCDAETATAVSDLVFVRRKGDRWIIGLAGRYDDTLRCEGGVWRFASRVLTFVT